MKTKIKKTLLITFTAMLMLNINLKAQITLDHTLDSTLYGYMVYHAKISDHETKYVFLDTINDKFSLYNLDFTPFLLNIHVPHPLRFGDPNPCWYSIMYISRTLFDCDSTNIEYLFASQNCTGHPLWVMRTDGTVLLYKDTTQGLYCLGCPGGTTFIKPIFQTENGAKLLTFITTPESIYTYQIYSLCGTLPVGEEEFDFSNQQPSFVTIYPNPSSMQLNFDIHPPDNLNNYELIILNINSQEIKRQKIRSSENLYTIDVRDFSNSTYYYSLASKNKIIQTGKFIINK